MATSSPREWARRTPCGFSTLPHAGLSSSPNCGYHSCKYEMGEGGRRKFRLSHHIWYSVTSVFEPFPIAISKQKGPEPQIAHLALSTTLQVYLRRTHARGGCWRWGGRIKTEQFHHRYVSGIPTLEFAVPKGELLQLELDFHSFPNRWGKHQQDNQCVRLWKSGQIQLRHTIQHRGVLHQKKPTWLGHSRPHRLPSRGHWGMHWWDPGPLLCKLSFRFELTICVVKVPRCINYPLLPSLLPGGGAGWKILHWSQPWSRKAPAVR